MNHEYTLLRLSGTLRSFCTPNIIFPQNNPEPIFEDDEEGEDEDEDYRDNDFDPLDESEEEQE